MTESDLPTNETITFWKETEIDAHRSTTSGLFNIHLLPTLPSSSEEKYNILFPLCGKSPDMKTIIDAGHHVFGIECAAMAIKAFFDENEISYEIENDTCPIYKGTEHSITIFCTDFLTFDKSLSPIDCIWDYGGMVAVNRSEQELYRDCLRRLMIPSRTQLYLDAYWCDNPDFTGPPISLSDDQVETLFGSTCSIELIQVSDITNNISARRAPGPLGKIEERLHRIIMQDRIK